jgi:copper(I)-binding protein
MRWAAAGFLAASVAAVPAAAAEGALDVSRAWTPALGQARVDAPIYMTVTNHGDAPDSLVRVRCPADLADATEKHATDRGEGGTAMREVKSLAVPAGGTVTLAPGGSHLMLLNVREPLREGQTFRCSLVFQRAGTIPVEVRVAPDGAKEAP